MHAKRMGKTTFIVVYLVYSIKIVLLGNFFPFKRPFKDAHEGMRDDGSYLCAHFSLENKGKASFYLWKISKCSTRPQ